MGQYEIHNNADPPVASPLTRSQTTRHLSLKLAVGLETAVVQSGDGVDVDEVMRVTKVFHNWIAKGDMPAEVVEAGAVT